MPDELTERERAVLRSLSRRGWTSPSEIGRDVWGPFKHSASASPVCLRLVAKGKLERNHRGWYRRLLPSDAIT